ncbi:hypothetical protein AIT67_016390 [Salmonella enterica subsp. salamae]|nr:hypothetical protein AIT67_016390 [Salmonella enterica subsp. salamae]
MTMVQTQRSRIQTVYAPGSFTPLVRIETDAAEQAKAKHRSLAEKLEQEGSGDGEAVQFPAALRAMLDGLEDELRRDAVSEESRQCFPGGDQMFVCCRRYRWICNYYSNKKSHGSHRGKIQHS